MRLWPVLTLWNAEDGASRFAADVLSAQSESLRRLLCQGDESVAESASGARVPQLCGRLVT